jgi:hypothetical protein
MTDPQTQELWITLRFKGYANASAPAQHVAEQTLADLQAHLELRHGALPFAISQPGEVIDVEEEAQIYDTQEPTPLYDHAMSIAFSLRSEHPSGEDLTAQQIRNALYHRLARLDDDELIEATGAPFDTYEVDQSIPVPIPAPPAEITQKSTFQVDHEASDETYFSVQVAGIATVTIKRESEGIVADIYPLHASGEPVASSYAFDDDLTDTAAEPEKDPDTNG